MQRAAGVTPMTTETRRNILVVTEWYPSIDDPVQGVFVEEQAIALSARHRVAVLVIRRRRWREGVRGSHAVSHETRHGIHIVTVDAIPPVPRWPRATYVGVRRAVLSAYDAIVTGWGAPDLVHAHVVRYAGWASLALARTLRVPAVLTEHSGPFDVHLQTRLDRTAVYESLGSFAAVIAVSPVLKTEIEAVRDVAVDVVGNVVDTDFFAPDDSVRARRDGEFRVATASVLVPSKRADLIIAAVAEVARTVARPVALTILGDGPERRSLERLVSQLGLGSAVRFTGMADRHMIRDELRNADLFVLASESETFGIVAAEAMACGTPAVVTLNGGSQYVVGAGLGIHVPVGDPAAIADAIRAVMDGTVQIDLERARASIVSRFSPSAIVAALERIYERVSSESPPSSPGPPSPPPHFVS